MLPFCIISHRILWAINMLETQIPIDRRRFLATTGMLGGGLLAGCLGDNSPSGESAGSGTFIGTTAEDAPTLDPRMNELAWVNDFLHYVFDTLYALTPDGSEIKPHLATEQPTKPDETTHVIKIQEGVTFHDGSELTAEDVAFSFNWVLNPDNKSPNRANIAFIKSVEATGEYEVTFNLNNPFALFKLTLTGMAGAIVPKAIAKKQGPKKFGKKPIGTGPFKFEKQVSSSHITLARNDDYWLKKPKLSKIKERVIPKPQVQFVELSTGGVHEATVPKTLLQKAKSEQNIQMKKISQFDYNGLIFNTMREPFDNPKVREAMQYLVDYDELLETSKGPLGKRSYGFMPLEVNKAWDFPWKEWKQTFYPPKDHNKAKQLLEEAGYGDGIGKTLKMSSLASSKFKDMMIIFQNELKEVGIKSEVQEVTIGQWLTKLDKGKFDVNIYGWAGGQDPDGFFYYLFRDLRNDDGGLNEDVVGNASAAYLYQSSDSKKLQQVDKKIRKARRLQDKQKRRDLYIEIAQTWQGLYPNISVFSEQSATAWSTDLKNYEPTGFAAQPLCNKWNNAHIKK